MRDRGLWAIVIVAAVIGGILFAISRINVGEVVREVTLPLRHDDIIRQQAERHDIDPALIAGIIYHESRFRDQTSHAGARGLMQITPDTADTIETLSGGETFVFEDLANPDLNIRYGTYYLNYLLDMYGGNVVAALAAYNSGPGNVDAWGGSELEVDDIEFPETKAYVQDVLERRDEYEKNYADELGL